MKLLLIASLFISLLCTSCGSETKAENASDKDKSAEAQVTAVFDGDSAYAEVERVVAFGPRVPGTVAHAACGDYIVARLTALGADTLLTHSGVVSAYNGDKLPYRNILARYNPQARRRVLLLAHWDTRPWADEESEADSRKKPVLGANDGGSGTGVLLELARLFAGKRPAVGVDLLFVDAEDYGNSGGYSDTEATWCLGTQEWLKTNPYNGIVAPDYGILLDMVGARDAIFYREYTSQHAAPQIVDKVWARAAASGYGDRFVNSVRGAVTDDHTFVNRAGIPCVDIIECANPTTGSFHPSWHTLADDMEVIDASTLKAVGQVVTDVVYNEKL